MADQWHDDSISSAQVKDDDDDAPDDWEAELEEKVCSYDSFFSLYFSTIYSFSQKLLMLKKNPKYQLKQHQQLKTK